MSQSKLEKIAEWRMFGGRHAVYQHASQVCNCTMRFAIFLPPQSETAPVPALYWLSGLTCTEENFSTKAGAQRYAAEHAIALIIPDTSPRGLDLPGEHKDWWFGSGASFYLDATVSPWRDHYNMYSYVVHELPQLVEANFHLNAGVRAISGHSMGGHGALQIALKNPHHYRSVSAFSPICAPTQSPWGRHALASYLGDDQERWDQYDSTALALQQPISQTLMVDQGSVDEFLEAELKPELLQQACQQSGQSLELRMQHGYDHSYYFVASFIGEHIAFHAQALKS